MLWLKGKAVDGRQNRVYKLIRRAARMKGDVNEVSNDVRRSVTRYLHRREK
ncbi:hypothetical protein [Paraburkholderia tropica]|uniref:hypothetical protein n=1 Tax=Paraburkholderia tropica TaxID=92647 RepID=UPI0012EAA742|nr:hypothetical protein [Paraburkholderia tropica]MBB2978410.1 hypothetical protein [Paraburkholderia tropica]